MSTRIRYLFLLFLVCALSAMFRSSSFAGRPGVVDGAGPPPKIFATTTQPFGATYAEWSARWWQWAFSMPVDQHPLFETADWSEGQSGHVWFLGPSFSTTGLPGEHTGEVPTGRALFFAILTAEASTLEGNGTTEAELGQVARDFVDLGQNLWCEVDGYVVPDLESYRVQSPLYTLGPLPAHNILDALGYPAPQDATSPSVADGVYIMLAPLAPGTHTIHVRMDFPGVQLDDTYHLRVGSTAPGLGTEEVNVPLSGNVPTRWGFLKTRYRP